MFLELAATGSDGKARRIALEAIPGEAEPTALVGYRSAGRLLVLGSLRPALAAVERLGGELQCTVLAPEVGPGDRAGDPELLRGRASRVVGHLGAFRVYLAGPDGELELGPLTASGQPQFDLVLDLNMPPLLDQELPPPGYYAPGSDPAALDRALAELPERVGEFEKPAFFVYDPAICAHGRRGQRGCTRCLEVCPARAIQSLGELIQVDPYLCQGAGSCAAACPTGAIRYAYPRATDTLDQLRRLLRAYGEAGGSAPWLLFHDAAAGRERLARLAGALPERVLPVELNELGSTGLEVWLTALAYGAGGLAWLAVHGLPPSVHRELNTQLDYARAMLEGMGFEGRRLRWLEGDDAHVLAALEGLGAPSWPAAGFAVHDQKRQTLRLAVDHLYRHAPRPQAVAALPSGAPFGQVQVDRDACTLCMGCVAVCPTQALTADRDAPRLNFSEALCVQCGLCERACPEQAISLTPRFIYDPEQRRGSQVLNEEPPFCCIQCGKPFATRALIHKMTEKLHGHWMFQDDKALNRLRMCESCRVEDLYRDGQAVLAPRKERG